MTRVDQGQLDALGYHIAAYETAYAEFAAGRPNQSSEIAHQVMLLAPDLLATVREQAAEIERLRAAVTFLVVGVAGGAVEHPLTLTEDGDGWNEPSSEAFECGCEEWGVSWVQQDRKCSNRPDLIGTVMAWVDHINLCAALDGGE